MSEAIQLACHRCGTALQPPPGLYPGQTITCPRCSALVKAPGDVRTAPSGGVDPARLGMVLIGALLYLLGGAALALYCFDRNARKPAPAPAPGEASTSHEDAPLAPLTVARPATVAVDSAEQRKINDAISRGVWYLKDHIQPTGTWGNSIGGPWNGIPVGLASLPGLTLLECGVSRRDPVVLKAAAFVRAHAPNPAGAHGTYQRALAILFLDRLGDTRDEALIQYLALCLVAGQRSDDGGWGYHCPDLDPKMTQDLLTRLRDNQQSLDRFRQVALKGGRYDPGRSDNSNTQFAILGLWAARRHRVAVERSLARVDERFRTTQRTAGKDPRGTNLDLDGSWDYSPAQRIVSSTPWPSMTCAGLLGLAVANGLAAEKKGTPDTFLEERAGRIRRGLAMLGREIDRPGEKRGLDLYFLWSLERVGVLYNLKKIEGKDWYAWGRKLILPRQQADGSWKAGIVWYPGNPVVDTCFALLFLQQANLAADLTGKLQLLEKK